MAIGDDALAAGMDLVSGTALANTIDTEINKDRDYIAQRTNAVTPVAKGGTGATTADGARSNLGIPAWSPFSDGGKLVQRAGDGRFGIPDAANDDNPVTRRQLNAVGSETARAHSRLDSDNDRINAANGRLDSDNNRINDVRAGNLSSDVYGRNIGGNRRSVWVSDGGQLGYAASTERLKKNIKPENVTDEQVLMLHLVSYQWRAAVAVDDRREMGLIAERLIDAGLGWACFYDADGTPEGINYEMVGVALVPAVKRLIGRVAALEESA